MLEALHRAGHKYLKLLFVAALAGSSALFFIGSAMPKPPGIVVVVIGGALGIALEWAFFTVSSDLTQSISEGSKGGIARDLLYTLIGGAASWFLFTNAALHVGWAPNDDLLGLSRKAWAMIMALLIVLVIFALSARRQPVKEGPNLQAIGRFVEMYAPNAPTQIKTQLMAAILTEAAKYGETNHLPKTLPAATVVEPAAKPTAPALQIPTAERIPMPPPAMALEDRSDLTGIYANLPMPGVSGGQGNHRYTSKEGGPFRPGSTES